MNDQNVCVENKSIQLRFVLVYIWAYGKYHAIMTHGARCILFLQTDSNKIIESKAFEWLRPLVLLFSLIFPKIIQFRILSADKCWDPIPQSKKKQQMEKITLENRLLEGHVGRLIEIPEKEDVKNQIKVHTNWMDTFNTVKMFPIVQMPPLRLTAIITNNGSMAYENWTKKKQKTCIFEWDNIISTGTSNIQRNRFDKNTHMHKFSLAHLNSKNSMKQHHTEYIYSSISL